MIFLDVVHTASGNWTARIFGKTPTGLLIYKYDIFPNTEWGKNQAVKLAMKWFHENPDLIPEGEIIGYMGKEKVVFT